MKRSEISNICREWRCHLANLTQTQLRLNTSWSRIRIAAKIQLLLCWYVLGRPVERRGKTGGVSYPGLATIEGPRRRSEIQSTQECTILERKKQINSPQKSPAGMFGAPRECFPNPRCGSQRVWCSAPSKNFSEIRSCLFELSWTQTTKLPCQRIKY